MKLKITALSWRVALFYVISLGFVGDNLWAAPSFRNILSTTASGTVANGYQATVPTGVPAGANFGGSLDLGGTAQGHIMFKQGFTINNGTSGVVYDADGEVNGPITFSAATNKLTLLSDLRLGSTASFVGSVSHIIGTGKRIVLNSDVVLTNQVVNLDSSSLTIDGQGHTMTIRSTGTLAPFATPTANVSLTLKDMTLRLNPSSASNVITLFNGAGTTNRLILDNVKIELGPNAGSLASLTPTILASSAVVIIRNDVQLFGPGKAIKIASTTLDATTGYNIYIEKNSRLYVGPDLTIYWPAVNLGGLTAGFNSLKLGMADQTSILQVSGGTIDIDYSRSGLNSGLQLTKGTVVFEDQVYLNNGTDGLTSGAQGTETDLTYGFIFGDGTAPNDVNVRVLGGAYVRVNGCCHYKHA